MTDDHTQRVAAALARSLCDGLDEEHRGVGGSLNYDQSGYCLTCIGVCITRLAPAVVAAIFAAGNHASCLEHGTQGSDGALVAAALAALEGADKP